jgi:hypothetical protein
VTFLAGDIVCIKATGERVCILGANQDQGFNIRRPIVTTNGEIHHESSWVYDFELETNKDHAKRQIADMIMKAEAQKELYLVESRLTKEVEQEAILDTPKPAAPVKFN